MFTNAREIYLESFQKGSVNWPDRYSYRQRNIRKNGYKFRLYWHFKKYLENDCTIIFDTLTYDDRFLPHASGVIPEISNDFSCFRPSDLKGFLDRLHSILSYYDLPSFTHFICSEYGKDNLYVDCRGHLRKGTKRPHYHILLFFEGKVDPVYVAKLIHNSWKMGRTDNYGSYEGERSRTYVLHNTFTKDSVSLDRLLRLSDYLSKYVLKDVKFSRKVDKLCYKVVRSQYPMCVDRVTSRVIASEVNNLRRCISEFVLISNKFGDYFLEPQNLDLDLIYSRSMVRMPDKDRIWNYIKLPEYYLRKLFYKLKNGSWQLNDLGKDYYQYRMRSQVRSLDKLYTDVFLNLSDEDSSKVVDLLAGRSFTDLAQYVTYYRGRVMDLTNFSFMPTVDDVCRLFVEPSGRVISNDPIAKIDYYYRPEPRYHWCIVDDFYPSTAYKYLVVDDILHRQIVVDTWKDKIIDDSYSSDWIGFDEILKIFQVYLDKNFVTGQEVYDKKEQLEIVFSS